MTIPFREVNHSVEEFPGFSDAACEAFQSKIPHLIGGNIYEEEHMQSCLRCKALVEELEYIAEAARLYLSAEEPPDTIWKNIEVQLPHVEETNEKSGHTPIGG